MRGRLFWLLPVLTFVVGILLGGAKPAPQYMFQCPPSDYPCLIDITTGTITELTIGQSGVAYSGDLTASYGPTRATATFPQGRYLLADLTDPALPVLYSPLAPGDRMEVAGLRAQVEPAPDPGLLIVNIS